ncbi:MAG: glycerol-phosphatase [Solirubrobacteraceae bacterium]|jgi:HAD superfamily hydrolase (TIGR01450 family)|nr:glycerol-phosphatase [Solirubrobacteraceae bacterium]
MPLSPLLRRYDHVLLDLDGCVWVGDEPTERAVEAVAALREEGRGLAFVTNDARHAGEEFVRKLWRLGFQASLEEVVTVGGALQHWLAGRRDRAATAFVIGSAAIWRHVEDAGLRIVNDTDLSTRADLVVTAGHDDFDYAELRDAVQALARGAGFVTAGRDPSFPMPDGPWPGTGAIAAAVETASGATAINVGKPEAALFEAALDRMGAVPERTLVVGDRLDADLAGADAAGLDAAIVLTGATDRAAAEAAKQPAPVAVAATLAELVLRS